VFDRIAVISRGEPAMRLTRAFWEADDEAVLLRETGAGDPYLDDGELPRALPASGASAPPPIHGCGRWRPW
jgi:hypothetical protein